MERKLASVQRVVEVRPIEGADRIEMIRVLGWECVVKKGAFKVGDTGVYIEIDSIVPDTPPFAFMKDRKFRVKTIKLKGQMSQGLFMSFEDLGLRHYSEGRDLTSLLGIVKYEPPEEGVSSAPKKKSLWLKLVYTLPFLAMFRKKVGEGSAFPSHLVPKTDETRLQAFDPDFLVLYKDVEVSITQKMDGSSCSFIWNKGKFSVASRNVWFIEKKDNKFWKMADLCEIAPAMKSLFGKRNIVLQGEMCGPSIQGNKYNLSEQVFYLFSAYDSDKREYFTPDELLTTFFGLTGEKGLPYNFQHVDILVHPQENKKLKDCFKTVDEAIAYATTKSRFTPKTYNEGIVIRSNDDKPFGVRGMNGKRFSFKVISPEYLIQHNL